MTCIARGFFEVVNPFNRKVKVVPAAPADVHTIVFWSKDFGIFLKHNYGKKLQNAGYHLFFNFTVNSTSSQLEPRVSPIECSPGSAQTAWRPIRTFGDQLAL
jgi:hypothetical protein